MKPSLPHHGPSILERWHRSFHPPNPWYKKYRLNPPISLTQFWLDGPIFLRFTEFQVSPLFWVILDQPLAGWQTKLFY